MQTAFGHRMVSIWVIVHKKLQSLACPARGGRELARSPFVFISPQRDQTKSEEVAC